jgi:hypothetical protein
MDKPAHRPPEEKNSFDDLDVRIKCFIFVKIVPHKGAVIRLRMEDNPAFIGVINELKAMRKNDSNTVDTYLRTDKPSGTVDTYTGQKRK